MEGITPDFLKNIINVERVQLLSNFWWTFRRLIFMDSFNNLDNGWRKVTYKYGGKKSIGVWDIENGGRKRSSEGEITSFFFTEFGDTWKAKDIFFELKEFGELVEVVIPPR